MSEHEHEHKFERQVDGEQSLSAMTNLDRERALYLYSTALDEGDFDTVAAVLKQAEVDRILENMLLELEAAYAVLDTSPQVDSVQLVQQLLQEHFGPEDNTSEELAVPDLTVAEVVVRLQTDMASKGTLEKEITSVTHQLRQLSEPVPGNLSRRNVRQMFELLGVVASERFQKAFRETAILLSMGREQGKIRLAATRRQQQLRRTQHPHQHEQPGIIKETE